TYTLTCVSGTPNAYTATDTTLTFTAIDTKTVYAITGYFAGNIVIDVGDTYKFDLELTGFTLTSDAVNPITILSGDEVSLTAKSGTENFIYDTRAAIDETDTTLYSAAVYSLVDLELSGKGSLTLVSENNNGIHTKDDLQVKNLTLSVTCTDNALKGNDSVEITNANTTLIATQGDCIKTTNSHISETTASQKGTVTISGGTHRLYAACDGIDAAYNAVIENPETVLEIYTDRYSEYSEEVTAVSDGVYYLRYTSTAYRYAIKYANSETDTLWVTVDDSYETVTSSGGRPGQSNTYYYYSFPKNANYATLTVYMYTSTQTPGQDTDYYAVSESQSLNASYDTLALTVRSGALSISWTNYTTTSASPGGGMGGMPSDGNTDKGTYSTKGIKAANEIFIYAGTVSIQSYDDAIHAGGSITLDNGNDPLGNVTVGGGTITVAGNDDGIHADGTLTISDGIVRVTKSYEGLEGAFISITGGTVSVCSSDDGINGTSTSGNSIVIAGGTVYVYASGDGIDSNSTTSYGGILFTGGYTTVFCTSNGNSAIDTEQGYTHTGGYVVALTTTGGMTSETTHGNTAGMTTKSSLSLASGGYLTVSFDSSTAVTVKMPCAMTAYVVCLGSSSATVASATSSDAVLDADGVCWAVAD
ncbi:MAG: carbohydrate-binding domain-containing protein, partial [Eubacteriales bacterium]